MSFWDGLDDRYRAVLCDIWGVVHDGVHLYPNAAERLTEWRRDGRRVILITNAPRTADAVEQQLGRIGLPTEAWDGIASSGEAGIAARAPRRHDSAGASGLVTVSEPPAFSTAALAEAEAA